MFVFAEEALRLAERFLQRCGDDEVEGVVLFAGSSSKLGRVDLPTLIIPRQIHHKGMYGVAVEIPEAEALELIEEVCSRSQRLLLKIHTHPREASHSPADDENMLMRFDGAISAVIPDFAKRGLKGFPGSAWYRFHGRRANWRRVSQADVAEIHIQKMKWEFVNRYEGSYIASY